MRPRHPKRDQVPFPLRILGSSVVVLVILLMGLPMVNVLAVSLSEAGASDAPGLVLFPSPATLQGYFFIWNYVDLRGPFLNTLYVSVVGTLIHVILSSLAGYILTQQDLPFRGLMTSFVLLTMTVPSELALIGIYTVNKDLQLVNTYAGLIVNGMISGFSVLLMRNYFSSIPTSLVEAARIDGCSEFKIFRRVYLHLSVPGIMTIGTLELIRRWNNISLTVALISDMKKWTLPVVLRWILFDQTSTSGTEYIFNNAKMAAVVLTALPLVILYFFAQRFFTAGALLGSTKG
jgi:putative aldouronate transport system permease protein